MHYFVPLQSQQFTTFSSTFVMICCAILAQVTTNLRIVFAKSMTTSTFSFALIALFSALPAGSARDSSVRAEASHPAPGWDDGGRGVDGLDGN